MKTRLLAPVLAAACLALSACNSRSTAGFLIDGDLAYDATQWPRAAASYEQYLEAREGDHRVRKRLGQSYIAMGDYTQAVHHLRLVHTQVPGDVETTNALAEGLFRSGKNDELYRLLRSEAVESQGEADWMRLGDYAIKLGDKDTAQTAYLSASKVSEGRSITPYIALFDYYRGLGQREDAIRNVRFAAWVDRNSSKVAERIKLAGVIDGPTLPLMPPEAARWAVGGNPPAASSSPPPAPAPTKRPAPRVQPNNEPAPTPMFTPTEKP